MNLGHDHEYVDTPHGSYKILSDTDEVIPLYVFDGTVPALAITNSVPLIVGGLASSDTDQDDPQTSEQWELDVIEPILGKPSTYISRTTRVFFVLPDVDLSGLDYAGLCTLLESYAAKYDLNIKLSYYHSLPSTKTYYNQRNDDPTQRRLSIDIIGREAWTELAAFCNPAVAMFNDMHLSPGWNFVQSGTTAFDVAAMAEHCTMRMPRNTEYDYNILAHCHVVDGTIVTQMYPIGMIGVREV